MNTLVQIATGLASGETCSRTLLDQCLENAKSSAGEGERVFVKLYEEVAIAQAEAVDKARKLGVQLSPYAGIPISIKDLFDVAGETTLAGSKALASRPVAVSDAPVIQRLRQAGFVIIGKTNMTEFAYSGLGINEHYGTPKNPYDRESGRIPGGSTSGGAVSVTDAMAYATLGTDTGGSCRIPAALTGIVGFKTTSSRIPQDGLVPLSSTQDAVGPLANSVQCCSVLDSILTGESSATVTSAPIKGLRLAALQNYVLDGLDEKVGESYSRTLGRLANAGVQIVEISCQQIEELPAINAKGGFVGAEAFAWHRNILKTKAELYDPWVRSRFEAGKSQSAADYLEVVAARIRLRREVDRLSGDFDCLLMPTVPVIAPTLSDMENKDLSLAMNKLLLRNTSIANFLDRCAISIPCHEQGTAPVGLMLMGETNGDRRLLSIAAGIEQLLSQN